MWFIKRRAERRFMFKKVGRGRALLIIVIIMRLVLAG